MKRRGKRGPGRRPAARVLPIEERSLPIVREIARVAAGPDPPAAKLEGALEILFGAYGESASDFSSLLLTGWIRARSDKRYRLTMAWLREQLRLSIQEILEEGVGAGAVRRDVDPGALAGAMVGAAEGCLLQAAADGGAVPPAAIVRTLLRLAVSGA